MVLEKCEKQSLSGPTGQQMWKRVFKIHGGLNFCPNFLFDDQMSRGSEFLPTAAKKKNTYKTDFEMKFNCTCAFKTNLLKE